VLAFSVFSGGCFHKGEIKEDLTQEKETVEMIQIQDLTLSDGTLTLNYRVLNPFEERIWACYDTWVHGERNIQNTSTRIDGETVFIKLRFNLESTGALTSPLAIAKYVRLLPGESFSGRILQDLPIKDYLRESDAKHKKRKKYIEHKDIVLHRVVFEIGYIGAFGPEWDARIDSWARKMKEGTIESKPKVSGSIYYLPVNPLITEETLDGQLREVMYLWEYSPIQQKEKFADITITDVNIPCSIVIDDN
jgi:hypothetical protein